MQFSRKTAPLLGLAALAALALAAVPAAAQSVTYTLNGVTFDDGATADGYLTYNTVTHLTDGPFDITTTNGLTDAALGFHYTVANSILLADSANKFGVGVPNGEADIYLFFDPTLDLSAASHSLVPGSVDINGDLFYSGEFTDDPTFSGTAPTRAVTAGSLSAAPVPEASTTVSLGLLLALGMGGIIVTSRRKRTMNGGRWGDNHRA